MGDVIVYLAGVPWDAVKGTDRHLAERLGRLHPVLWVDPPVSAAVAYRRGAAHDLRRLRNVTEVSDGVTRLSVLVTPFPERVLVARATDRLMRAAVHAVLHQRGDVVRAVISASPFASLRAAPEPVGGRRVYYATDDFVAGAALLGHAPARLERAEKARLREAGAVAAVSDEILRRWDRWSSGTVLANGCDPDAFATVDAAPPAVDVGLRGPVAGIIGQLSSRIDLALLEAVAHNGMSLLLVGPVTGDIDHARFNALVELANVVWTGPQRFEDLPALIRSMDVGLTPYADTAFNRASFPLKTLEYLSAGRAVVSTPLPAVQALNTTLVEVARSPQEFAAKALGAAAGDSAALRRERRAFAMGHSWDARAAAMLEVALAPGAATTAGTSVPSRAVAADESEATG